jgi:hypothetical protein
MKSIVDIKWEFIDYQQFAREILQMIDGKIIKT